MHTLDSLAFTLVSALALTACSGKSTGSQPTPNSSDANSAQATTTTLDDSTSTTSTVVTSNVNLTPTITTASTSDRNTSTTVLDAGNAPPDKAESTTSALYDAALNTTRGTEPASTELDAGSNVQEDLRVPLDAAFHTLDGDCLAVPLSCGDHIEHSTTVSGVSIWSGYNSSQRAESGKEVLYFLPSETHCAVSVELSQLDVDLDLFLLTQCDPITSTQASSTPIDLQTVERLEFVIDTGEVALVAVDGYSGEEGSYTLDVACDCSD